MPQPLSSQPGWAFQIADGALWARSPLVPDATGPGLRHVWGHAALTDDLDRLAADLVAAMDVHEARELAGDNPHLDHDEYAIGVAGPKGPGFEPVLAIPGLAPVPSILTSAKNRTRDNFGVASRSVKLPDDSTRTVPAWTSGISWRSTQSLVQYGRAYCGDATLEVPPGLDKPEFYPYMLYVPYSCDWVLPSTRTVEGETITVDSYEADATDSEDAMTAWSMSRELWTGAIESQNPSLQNTAVDESASSAVHPVTALGTLLEAYSDCTQEGGAVIHAPLSAITSLLANYAIRQQGDVYYGPGGSIVSPGPGYPSDATGTGPDSADDPDAGTGNVWMYVTGPVEYALGDIVVYPEGGEAFYNHRENRYEVTAQRLVIHRFDTHCVFAVRTYIPSPAQGEGV